MGSRVGEIRIHARVPAALATAGGELKQRIERDLVVGVLEEVERQIHARLGVDAIVRVRHLSLAWRLGHDELGAPAELVRLADELVRDLLTALDAQPVAERLRPRDRAVVRFVDEPHAVAAWLADAADGQPRQWFQAERAEAVATWDEVVAAGPATVAAVVAWLERMERLAPALALASETALTAVAALDEARRAVVALARARRHATRTAGATATGDGPGGPGADGPAPLAAEASRPSPRTSTPGRGRGAPAPPVAVDGPAAAGSTATAAAVWAASAPGLAVPPGSADARIDDGAPAPDARIDDAPPTGLRATTQHAGVLFLAARVLELDLAEQLWAAGVDEGAVLTAIAGAIVDDVDDPACAWLGGAVERAPAAPAVAAWAAREIIEASQHALGRRLVRFGVTHTPAALADALATLTAAWPVSPTIDPSSAEVVRHGAGTLAMIVAARLGQAPTRALLQAVCRRPGELVWTADALHVIMPAAAIELDLRRAGLDQNVAFVPWLRRRLVFEYVGRGLEAW